MSRGRMGRSAVIRWTPAQRDQMRREYQADDMDSRVLWLLDELDWLEAELARAVQRAEQMEARLVRRVPPRDP